MSEPKYRKTAAEVLLTQVALRNARVDGPHREALRKAIAYLDDYRDLLHSYADAAIVAKKKKKKAKKS